MNLDIIIRKTRTRLWLMALCRCLGTCVFAAVLLSTVLVAADKMVFLDVPIIAAILVIVTVASWLKVRKDPAARAHAGTVTKPKHEGEPGA